MKRILPLGALLIAFLLFLSESVHGQKGAPAEKATPGDYALLKKQTAATGFIVSADAATRSVTFRIGASAAAVAPKKKQPMPVVGGGKDFELVASEKVVVKRTFLKIEYDDKGNVLDIATQKKTLAAKGSLPVKFEDIRSGMAAKITLAPPKAGEKDAKSIIKTIELTKDTEGPLLPAGTELKKKKNK